MSGAVPFGVIWGTGCARPVPEGVGELVEAWRCLQRVQGYGRVPESDDAMGGAGGDAGQQGVTAARRIIEA